LEDESAELRLLADLLDRAARDPDFRNALFRNPAQALESLKISKDSRIIIEKTIAGFSELQ
jgi:hypothetical protein